MKFIVAIKRFSDDSTEKEIECTSMHQAEKVESGVNINLNHDEFYTDIEIPTEVKP